MVFAGFNQKGEADENGQPEIIFILKLERFRMVICEKQGLSPGHYVYYLIIELVLISCYLLFAYLFVNIYLIGSWAKAVEKIGKTIVIAYIWGAIGGTSYCSVHLAKEVNSHHRESCKAKSLIWPSILEPLGYLIFIFGSGFCGVLLYTLLQAGFTAAYHTSGLNNMSDPVLFSISFIGGHCADRVKTFINNLGKSIMKGAELPSEKK